MAIDQVVRVDPLPVMMSPGQAAAAQIVVTVTEGYHVQANPAAEEFLIPVRIEFKAKSALHCGRPVYPPGQPYRLEGTSTDLMTCSGTFRIVLPLKALETATPGDYLLRGVLRYQACDSRACLFPASVPVILRVRLIPEEAQRTGRCLLS